MLGSILVDRLGRILMSIPELSDVECIVFLRGEHAGNPRARD